MLHEPNSSLELTNIINPTSARPDHPLTLIIGPTGYGKSVLACALASSVLEASDMELDYYTNMSSGMSKTEFIASDDGNVLASLNANHGNRMRINGYKNTINRESDLSVLTILDEYYGTPLQLQKDPIILCIQTIEDLESNSLGVIIENTATVLIGNGGEDEFNSVSSGLEYFSEGFGIDNYESDIINYLKHSSRKQDAYADFICLQRESSSMARLRVQYPLSEILAA